MARDEFDRDLDEYLSARKRATRLNLKGFFVRFLPKRKERPIAASLDLPEQVEIYDEKKDRPSFFDSFKSSSKNVLSSFKKEPKESEEFVTLRMQAEDAVSDMKEIAKIALGMIRTLPDQQLRDFKQSHEFDRLKALLKKHELIK